MRFGAMLWLDKNQAPGKLRWYPKKQVIELCLTKEAAPLYGEVAQSRLQSLASTLEAEIMIKTAR